MISYHFQHHLEVSFFFVLPPNIADPVISWRHLLGVFPIFWRLRRSFVIVSHYFHIIRFLALVCEALLELDWFLWDCGFYVRRSLCGNRPIFSHLFPASNSFPFSGNYIKIEGESDMKKIWKVARCFEPFFLSLYSKLEKNFFKLDYGLVLNPEE